MDDETTQHVSLVKTYFDENANNWHDYYQTDKTLTNVILRKRKDIAVRFLCERLKPGGKVLDAGCGAGLIAAELIGRGYQVDAWDVSPKMIELAQRNIQETGVAPDQYTLRVGDILERGAESGPYDGILALGFLQYQLEEERTLRTLRRLMSHDACLVLSGPVGIRLSNLLGASNWIRKGGNRSWTQPTADRRRLHTISANSYSLTRFKTLLAVTGFRLVEWRGHGYAHFDILGHRLRPRLQWRLHRAMSALSALPSIQRFANDMVVVACKTDDP